jgi:hypothetical protein
MIGEMKENKRMIDETKENKGMNNGLQKYVSTHRARIYTSDIL